MEAIALYAIITTLSTAFFAWVGYRRHEIETLALEVYVASRDSSIDETEFQRIVSKLGDVLFKKE